MPRPTAALSLALSLALALAVLGGGCKKHDPSRYDATFQLEPSTWRGAMTVQRQVFPFVLVIDSVSPDGKVEGSMDWGQGLRTAVKGTAQGNHVQLVDYAFLEGNAGSLGDKKDFYIFDGVRLDGTDKGGDAFLSGTRAP